MVVGQGLFATAAVGEPLPTAQHWVVQPACVLANAEGAAAAMVALPTTVLSSQCPGPWPSAFFLADRRAPPHPPPRPVHAQYACDDHSTSLETKDILDGQEKPSLLFSDLRYHDPINGPQERYNARVVRSFNIHYGGCDCFVDVPRDDWHLCPVKAKRLQERPYVRCG